MANIYRYLPMLSYDNIGKKPTDERNYYSYAKWINAEPSPTDDIFHLWMQSRGHMEVRYYLYRKIWSTPYTKGRDQVYRKSSDYLNIEGLKSNEPDLKWIKSGKALSAPQMVDHIRITTTKCTVASRST